MTLKAILTDKPPGFFSVPPEMRISGVIGLLAEKRIGAVLVVGNLAGNQNELLGILSERDIVRSLAAQATATLELTAAQLMTPNPMTATPSPPWPRPWKS